MSLAALPLLSLAFAPQSTTVPSPAVPLPAPPPPPLEVLDVGLATDHPVASSRDVFASVRESAQGGVDLNGDFDTKDSVVHRIDSATGAATNLGVAGTARFLAGRWALLTVSESSQGLTDLNGDADANDNVAFGYEAATGTLTNYGVAIAGTNGAIFFGDDEHVAFRVTESGQRADLNGDGDTSDFVTHVIDRSTGTVHNLGVDTFALAFDGTLFLLTIDEDALGDLNGDGDTDDHVLHAYDPSSDFLANTGLACSRGPVTGDGFASFLVPEAGQSEDLNGDGDTFDSVWFVYDPFVQVIRNLGLAVAGGGTLPLVDGTRVVVPIDEVDEGVDLNGDGDAVDFVLHAFDLVVGTVENLGIAPNLGSTALADDLLAFEVDEGKDGFGDLNGDGDQTDRVVFVHDFERGTTTSLGRATTSNVPGAFSIPPPAALTVARGYVEYRVSEKQEGVDLNGDGDTSDHSLFTYEAATSARTDTGLVVPFLEAPMLPYQVVRGRRLVVLQHELDIGDANGDGDTFDLSATFLDLASGRRVASGLANTLVFDQGVGIVYWMQVQESGTDRNGDGDGDDDVLVRVLARP